MRNAPEFSIIVVTKIFAARDLLRPETRRQQITGGKNLSHYDDRKFRALRIHKKRNENILPEPLQLKQLTAAQLEQEQRGDALIVDTRAAEHFASWCP